MGTVAEYTLKTGTDKGDMTSIEYMNVVYRPALEKAMINMMWRLIWFGDKDAKNITGGSGQITDGVNTNLFTVADGFWKRLFAIITDNESQKTAIAAFANNGSPSKIEIIRIRCCNGHSRLHVDGSRPKNFYP